MKRRHTPAAAAAAGRRLQSAGLIGAQQPLPPRLARRATARKARPIYHPLTWRSEEGGDK